VAALAGGVEEVVEFSSTESSEQLGAAEWFHEIECGKAGPAAAEGFAQECVSIEAQDVKDHGDNGNFSSEEKIGLCAA
jgi:hypothetical protein